MSDSTHSPGVQRYIEQGAAANAARQQQRQRMRQMRFDTIAVHGLYGMEEALANQGSIVEPLCLSSAQHFADSDHMEAALAYLTPAWAYSRIANPTVGYLEETLALLEGYDFPGEVSACATGSGMAAVFMATNPFLVLAETAEPFNIVASARCYGGTFMLFNERYGRERGIEVRWVEEPLNLANWAALIDDNTRFVYGEMPSNPSLDVFDIAGVADLAHARGIPLLVDSTVATPALLRPLNFGADIVIHSVSKSMATSGFAIAGALIARHHIPSKVGPAGLRANFAQYVKLLPFRDHGPALSPFNALMILNDLRTLRRRMDYISHNCLQVARYLACHPAVEQVFYPGLVDNPGHDLAAAMMELVDSVAEYDRPVKRYGHLLSFTIRGGHAAARRVFDRLELIWRATDLGRIKSVATIPAISTHQQQGETGRALAAVPDNLMRLNVGGENVNDLIDDLDQALSVVAAQHQALPWHLALA